MKSLRLARVLSATAVVAALLTLTGSLADMAVASAGTPVPGAPNCPIFPSDNVWNTPITDLPVEAQTKLFGRKGYRERAGKDALKLFGDDEAS